MSILTKFSLQGKTALISGGYRGLGLSMATGFAEAGAHVILNGRNSQAVEAVAARLKESGLSASAAAFDITDEASASAGIDKAIEENGQIDILLNNAGIHQRYPLAEMPLDAFKTVIDTNLTAAFLLSRLVVKQMIENGGGKIINICSLMSDLARPTTGNYAAAKGGLKMLTRAMAGEWAKDNIQINSIGPGYFETEMTQALKNDEKFDSWICGRTPAGRWGKPEELQGLAVFLASPASSFINGQLVFVDGGLTSVV
ncbi:glucose 1-dehydrogenase [Puniceicoccaceae bacterium K14]|nr:glucose 1-dehydrogenase [Puniceicoccaceae bacterium K14]